MHRLYTRRQRTAVGTLNCSCDISLALRSGLKSKHFPYTLYLNVRGGKLIPGAIAASRHDRKNIPPANTLFTWAKISAKPTPTPTYVTGSQNTCTFCLEAAIFYCVGIGLVEIPDLEMAGGQSSAGISFFVSTLQTAERSAWLF